MRDIICYLGLIVAFIISCVAVTNLFGLQALVLVISIFSLFMFINLTVTTLGNAFIGREIRMNYDIFWKLLFMMISSLGFGIFFTM